MASASDSFTRADAANLGGNWTQTNGSFTIVSNQAVAGTTAGNGARHITPADNEPCYAELVYSATDAGISVFVGPAVQMPTLGTSLANTGEYYYLTLSGASMTVLAIRRKDNLVTTNTVLVTDTITAVTLPATLRLESTATELVSYLNGTEKQRVAKSVAVLTDTTQRGAGMFATANAAIKVDDWTFADTGVTTTTVRPNATTAAGGWTTGAASLHAALSDQSTATIITGTGA